MNNNHAEQVEVRKGRGNRARALRHSLRFSRRKFCERYGIAQATLQNWEDARYGGLSENGAHTLIRAYKNEGIDVAIEWLWYGIGNPPSNLDKSSARKIAEPAFQSEAGIIAEELKLF